MKLKNTRFGIVTDFYGVNDWSKTMSGLRKCPKLLSVQNEVRFGGAPIAVMCRAFDRLMSL